MSTVGVVAWWTHIHTLVQVETASRTDTLAVDELGLKGTTANTLSIQWHLIRVEATKALSETHTFRATTATGQTVSKEGVIELSRRTTSDASATHLDQSTDTVIAQFHSTSAADAGGSTGQAGDGIVQVVGRTLTYTVSVEAPQSVSTSEAVAGSTDTGRTLIITGVAHSIGCILTRWAFCLALIIH